MRISLTVFCKGKDPLKIALTQLNKSGINQYEITGEQFETKRRMLSKDEAERLQSLLEQLNVPAYPEFVHQQGDTYMLKLENVLNSANYIWCSEPPNGWEKLQGLVDFIIKIAP